MQQIVEQMEPLKMMKFDRETPPLKDITIDEIEQIERKYSSYPFTEKIMSFLRANKKGKKYDVFSYDAAASMIFFPETTELENYYLDGTWGRWIMDLPSLAMQLMYIMRRMREMVVFPLPEQEELSVKLRKYWLITVQATGMYIKLGDSDDNGYTPLPFYGVEQNVKFTHQEYSVFVPRAKYTEIEYFFETAYKVMNGKDLDYKDQEMYKNHSVVYALRFRESHMTQLSLITFTNDAVAPGDGSAAAKQVVERLGFKCDSSDLYPSDRSVRVSSISAALEEGDRSRTLVLCYINHFMTKEDWAIVQEYSSVVFIDAPFVVPSVPLERKGIFWVKEVPAVKKVIQQESFAMYYPDTLFTERLVSNSCYEVRSMSNYVEYIFQIIPSTRMMSKNPNVQLLLTAKGFPLPYENETPVLLITGLNELRHDDVDNFFYYAPVGRIISPIQLKVVQPHHKLLTRELYFCSLLDFWFLQGQDFAREVDGWMWISVRSEGQYWVKFRDAALIFRFSHKTNFFEFSYEKNGELKVSSKSYTVTVGKVLSHVMEVYDHLRARDNVAAAEFLSVYGIRDNPLVRQISKYGADLNDLKICLNAVHGIRGGGINRVWSLLIREYSMEQLRKML